MWLLSKFVAFDAFDVWLRNEICSNLAFKSIEKLNVAVEFIAMTSY